MITQAEWHESWRSGHFDVEASSSPTGGQDAAGGGPPGSGLRLLSRHLSHENLKPETDAASQTKPSGTKPSGTKPAKKGPGKASSSSGSGSRDRIAPEPELS